MLTEKEFKKIFEVDSAATEQLQKTVYEYLSIAPTMSQRQFLDWFFNQDGVYAYVAYVEVSPKLLNDTSIGMLIPYKEKRYICITLYVDKMPDITVSTLYIGNRQRDFLGEVDISGMLELYIQNGSLDNVVDTIDRYTSPIKKESKYFPTKDDWYGTYMSPGPCVLGTITKLNSTLDLWRITLQGNDDYSIARLFTSENEALAEWKRLATEEAIPNKMDGYFFNN